jgi:hypothetical protein
MIALVLAAGLATASPLDPHPASVGALQPDGKCQTIREQVRSDQEGYFRRLGRLPPAIGEYAVLRSVGGCMVPAPIGYHPPPAR